MSQGSAITEQLTYKYLLDWSDKFEDSKMWSGMAIYCLWGVSYTSVAFIRNAILQFAGLRVSRLLHRNMLYRVLHSKIDEFIEKVPTGQIVNRFSKDINICDTQIVFNLSYFIQLFCRVLGEYAMVVFVTSWYLSIAIVPLLIIGIWFQQYYMKIKREVVRFEAVTRSPLLNLVGDTLRGLPSIRAMELQAYMKGRFLGLLNANLQNGILMVALDSWFGLRISFLNLLVIQLPCYGLIVYFLCWPAAEGSTSISSTNIAYAIFAITSALTDTINCIKVWAGVESTFISFERCFLFDKIEPEAMYTTFDKEIKNVSKMVDQPLTNYKNSPAIVKEGELVFQEVSAKYQEDGDLVINDLSFKIAPREKIGIIGRTGAGKSSLIKLFWNCLAPCSGNIIVDGTNIVDVD
jgi:ATP-binding cassette subfamily C (CFTR/MRP) protein 1